MSSLKPKYTRGGLMNDKHKDVGTGKEWGIEGIYCFNKLFQLVRNDRLTNYQFVTCWLENKRDDFAFGEKKEAVYISQKVIHSRHYVTERVMGLMMS